VRYRRSQYDVYCCVGEFYLNIVANVVNATHLSLHTKAMETESIHAFGLSVKDLCLLIFKLIQEM